MYRMSAWEALSVVVENWGGEIDAEIGVDADGVVTRKVALKDRLGRDYVVRRFEWGHDITNISRKITDDPNACRLIPIGAAEQTEGGGYTRKITIESVNGGKDYLENENTVRLYRLPKPGGGWEYPTISAENSNAKTPAALKAWGLSVLEEYTTPKVTYSASVVALQEAGLDTDNIQLGDTVHVVDRGFEGEGLRLEGRVAKIITNELTDGDISLEIGSLSPTLADTIGGISRTAYAAMSVAEAAQGTADKLSDNFWVDENGNVHVTSLLQMVAGKTWREFKQYTWGSYSTQKWSNATDGQYRPTDNGYNILVDNNGIHLRSGA